MLELKPERGPSGFVSSVWEFPAVPESREDRPRIYRWYGTLPSGLVRRLLGLYATPESTVADIFSGVGTTLVEAATMGIPCIGYESNPLGCLVSKARLHPWRGSTEELRQYSNKVLITTEGEANFAKEALSSGLFGYTAKWFHPQTLDDLLRTAYRIGQCENPDFRMQALVALATTTKNVSNIDARCTHHLVTKKRAPVPVAPLLVKTIDAIATSSSQARVPVVHASKVIQANSLVEQLEIRPDPDFVIAHPPYPGVITYNLVHRPVTDMLQAYARVFQEPVDLDFRFERIKEADMSTDDDDAYFKDIEQLTARIATYLRPGGHCAFIIGDSRHNGFLRHPFTNVITAMEAHGLMLQENFVWVLNNNGGMHIKRRGHYIDHNYILVFARG